MRSVLDELKFGGGMPQVMEEGGRFENVLSSLNEITRRMEARADTAEAEGDRSALRRSLRAALYACVCGVDGFFECSCGARVREDCFWGQ